MNEYIFLNECYEGRGKADEEFGEWKDKDKGLKMMTGNSDYT